MAITERAEEFCGLVSSCRSGGAEYAAAISSGGATKSRKSCWLRKGREGLHAIDSDRLIHLTKLIMRIAISKSEGFHRTFNTVV